MKTITLYELLGMVKDGKELPKKVKVLDAIYEFDDHYGDYYNESLDRYLFVYMTSEEEWKLAFFLNRQVEIIEEEKKSLNDIRESYGLPRIEEKKIPEKMEEIENGDFLEIPSNHDIMNKINEVIDYLDYLKSKRDE